MKTLCLNSKNSFVGHSSLADQVRLLAHTCFIQDVFFYSPQRATPSLYFLFMRLCSLVWNTIIFIVFWAFQLLIRRRDSSDSLLSVLSEPPKLVMKSFIVSKSTSTSARLLASAYCKLLESLLSILRAPKSHLCDTAHHYLSVAWWASFHTQYPISPIALGEQESFSWLLPVFTEILLW